MMRGVRIAERAAGLDELALLDRDGRRAGDAGERRDRGQRDRDDDVRHRRARASRPRSGRGSATGTRAACPSTCMTTASKRPPYQPASMPIAEPISMAIDGRGDADDERDARAVEQARQDVAAEVVGAERVLRRRRPAACDRMFCSIGSCGASSGASERGQHDDAGTRTSPTQEVLLALNGARPSLRREAEAARRGIAIGRRAHCSFTRGSTRP